ncbi:neprosin family prolyl endopeptidase [Acidovorax sp. NCPPB 2350]|nr:neprosin family prolyl endopeptidase [Acidovorax sp. NCPPB 2350]
MPTGNHTLTGHRFPLIIAIACLLGSSGYASAASENRPSTAGPDYGYVDAMMPPLPPSRGPTLLQDGKTASTTAEFTQFLLTLNAATYQQLPPSSGVAGEAAFLEMKRYLQNRYNGVTVVKSLKRGGAISDCIPVGEQPGLRDGSAVASPPPVNPHGPAAGDLTAGEQCPRGTIPLERIGLDQLTHFATLKQFLSKGAAPRRPGVANEEFAATHHYAQMSADTEGVRIAGAGADLNIWNPAFPPSRDYMSISQIWVTSADSVQTLEVGWQRRPSYPNWGNKSILFIYSTQDGYRTGCHNLECGQFVQTASGNVFGVAFASNRYSVKNGAQGLVKVAFQRSSADGNWWLSVDGHWIGYYKASLYTGDLASPNASISFSAGGETQAYSNAPSTPMGSGVFAASGYRQSAFQANHFYIDDSLKAHAVTHLTDVGSTDPLCYTVAVAGLSYDSGTGVSRITPSPEMTTGGFYFGGPGCH